MHAVAIAVAASLLAAAPADAGYRELRVGSSQRSVEASAGSGCGSTAPGSGGCADAAYPLQLRETLFVRRGHAIAFDFDRPVDAVTVDRIEVEREGGTNRWTGTVPDALPDGFLRIGISSRWPGGDQHFEAGLHVIRRGRARVRVPRVTGRPQVEALPALERRGLWWRFAGERQRHFDSGPPIPPGSVATPGRTPRTQSLRPGTRVRRGTVVVLGF